MKHILVALVSALGDVWTGGVDAGECRTDHDIT